MAKFKYNNEELIKKAKSGDEESYINLLQYNERLCYHIAHKFSNTKIDIEDLASIAKIGLIKAYNTFDLDKGIKFATYCATIMHNEILMYLRKDKKHNSLVYLDSVLFDDGEGSETTLLDTIESPEEEFKFEDYEHLNNVIEVFKLKSKKYENEILDMYFYKKMNQKEIGKQLNLSQSYISRRITAINIKLKKISIDLMAKINRKEENNMNVNTVSKSSIIRYLLENRKMDIDKISEITGYKEKSIKNVEYRIKNTRYSHEIRIINLEDIKKYAPDIYKKIYKEDIIKEAKEDKKETSIKVEAIKKDKPKDIVKIESSTSIKTEPFTAEKLFDLIYDIRNEVVVVKNILNNYENNSTEYKLILELLKVKEEKLDNILKQKFIKVS